MPEWTREQNNAINAHDRNILVSAAAGSGKTAVLVERVIKMITDSNSPVDIDKLLIVTFTNAAAAEMKYRISDSLNKIIRANPDNSYIRRQLSLLANAKICTIDSFCTNLVKENFFTLSINQDFTTLEDSEAQLLEDNVINDVLDDFFKIKDKDFISLVETFTTPSYDKGLSDAVKKILRFIYAQPFPYYWLENMIELYNPSIPFFDTVWYEYIKNEIDYLFTFSEKLITENISMISQQEDKSAVKLLERFEGDYSEYSRLKNTYDASWNSFVNAPKAAFERMPRTTGIDFSCAQKVKANRNIYKSILEKDITFLCSVDEKEYTAQAEKLYPQLKALENLVKEVDSRLLEEKKERNAYSFSDIEHFAITLLFEMSDNGEVKRTELAQSLSENYYEILVDEYQDTNEAQDMLFTYLSNGENLFTVGDIKQSIYRFRLAMPHIFNNKKKIYKSYNENDHSKSSKIILDKNFRSRKGICSYVNFVFSKLMTEKLGELDYNEEEYLNYGAAYEESDIPSAQINILKGIKREDIDKKEAVYIARTIQNKINSKELIRGKDGVMRPIRYGDIAILMRSLKGHINEYAQALTQLGIPVICDNSTNLFDNNEIKMLLSLLRTIDNPMQDIPLLATMMSPIYGFTADELALIKTQTKSNNLYTAVYNSNNSKVKIFRDDISSLRKISITMSSESFIRYLVEEKGIIAFVNAMGNGEQRYQNIIKFMNFAHSFDKGINVGLTAFIRYVDKIIESEKKVDSAPVKAGGEDAVTIMSIHHSKGLEFPVCILASSSRQYNKMDLYDRLLLNTSLGIGIKCHNEEQLYQYLSLPYSVIKSKSTSELMSENLRVLYVAMTRAKEQFITFVSCDDLEKKLSNLAGNITDSAIDPYVCKKINSDADFILMTALLHNHGSILREICSRNDIVCCESDFDLKIEITDEIDIDETENDIDFVPSSEEILDQIKRKLSFEYERIELSNLSRKLTASSLDNNVRGFDYLTSSKPAFLNKAELTPAQRGSAMHAFMQFCDYKNAGENLEKEINRLTENGFISSQEAFSIDRKKLTQFFSSDFARRMFSSNKIYREIKISSFVKASEIYDTEFDDEILVQGIADCVFEENNKLILVDYKTDRVNDENELLDRYRNQISFYRDAVSKTLNKPVIEAVLYSFHLGKICSYKN